MSSTTVSLILNLVLLAILGLWLAIWLNRKTIVRVICLRKAARGQMEAIETILAEARKEHYITYDEEIKLRIEMGMPTDGIMPASADVKPTLKTHLQDLVNFYLPKKHKG
jgi:hypothetical protein